MQEIKNKELKIKSLRVNEETFERFKQIASEEFGNQGQCLDALIGLYEMENSKASLLERKLEIESFQDYLNKINQLFITSLQMSKDAEVRIKDEYVRQLSIKDTTIERLQAREKENIDMSKDSKEMQKVLEKRIKELESSNESLTLDKATLSQLVSRNHELLESNKRELSELQKYKDFKKENSLLEEQLSRFKIELEEVRRGDEQKNSSLDMANKEISYLEERCSELRKESHSYREFVEAIRKDHRREIEQLESKYNRMLENERERLIEEFDARLNLEKKTMELTIKGLNQEIKMLSR